MERLGEMRKGRREMIDKCSIKRIDREKIDKRELRLQFEEEKDEHQHWLLLVVQLPQGTVLLLSSRLNSAVCRSIEVLVSCRAAW